MIIFNIILYDGYRKVLAYISDVFSLLYWRKLKYARVDLFTSNNQIDVFLNIIQLWENKVKSIGTFNMFPYFFNVQKY